MFHYKYRKNEQLQYINIKIVLLALNSTIRDYVCNSSSSPVWRVRLCHFSYSTCKQTGECGRMSGRRTHIRSGLKMKVKADVTGEGARKLRSPARWHATTIRHRVMSASSQDTSLPRSPSTENSSSYSREPTKRHICKSHRGKFDVISLSYLKVPLPVSMCNSIVIIRFSWCSQLEP